MAEYTELKDDELQNVNGGVTETEDDGLGPYANALPRYQKGNYIPLGPCRLKVTSVEYKSSYIGYYYRGNTYDANNSIIQRGTGVSDYALDQA